jgi:tetratricopeptide (TPR) repeat protein
VLSAVAASLFTSTAAWGYDANREQRKEFTPGELALLPEYCLHIQGMPGYAGPPGDRWRALIGPDFQHFHHYCRGLRAVNYARFGVLPSVERRQVWEAAIGEYDYMIRASRADMVLMPEIFTRRGEALIQMGDLVTAQGSFERARALKPDYWPAYTGWVDHLVKLNQTAQARTLLEEGLRHMPDQPELTKRLEQLGKSGGAGR